MALATSMPVIGDLSMKFSRHSIHEQFQLPSFYQCFGQAKDLATLYLQPNVFFASRKSCQGVLFEFKGSESCDAKAGEYTEDMEYGTKAGVYSKSGDIPRSNTKPTAYADRTDTMKDIISTAGFTEFALEAIGDEGSSSEDDELTGYFSRQTELRGERATSTAEASAPTRSRRQHGRKRSMEQLDEDTSSSATKRCCRPRLNFEKMQLNMKAEVVCIAEDNPNYFRPISPQDRTT